MQGQSQFALAHDTARAQFDKLAESRSMLDKVRVELESLSKLGDMVTPEDVIKGAGKLVGAGLSPMAMAKLLSDMPDKPEALQAWVQQHAVGLSQRETQLEPVLAQARHQMGVTALRALTAHGAQPQPGAGGNPLLPSQTLVEQSTPASGNALNSV